MFWLQIVFSCMINFSIFSLAHNIFNGNIKHYIPYSDPPLTTPTPRPIPTMPPATRDLYYKTFIYPHQWFWRNKLKYLLLSGLLYCWRVILETYHKSVTWCWEDTSVTNDLAYSGKALMTAKEGFIMLATGRLLWLSVTQDVSYW